MSATRLRPDCDLTPFASAQQEMAIQTSLGEEKAARLRPYIEHTVPVDVQSGLRISTNPLMLSMVRAFKLRLSVTDFDGLRRIATDCDGLIAMDCNLLIALLAGELHLRSNDRFRQTDAGDHRGLVRDCNLRYGGRSR